MPQIHSLTDMSVASRSASRVGSSVPGMRRRTIAPMVVSVHIVLPCLSWAE